MNSSISSRTFSALGLVGLLIFVATTHAAEDPFKAGVRPTDKLTPAQQEETFTLPPGFEIRLFAAEPQIAKPMNVAFDSRGRMWATVTREYPTPAPLDKPGRDEIKILEDTDNDGRADKITTFADGLNIPIGIYPYQDGCIAWSIPNLWHLKDTNGDGKCDERIKLYGPLDHTRDTHGNNSSFTRGFDGWLYITHGFRNQSTLAGADGHQITLNSGNTYRIRLDGMRVEHFTHGQVNPFGMCVDPWGNFYTADCHSSPVYQLIRNGQYPGFGRPHDGLGFAPLVIQHSHGSTAISGIAWVDNPAWPKEFQGNVFIGNVMTSRVNRDRIDFTGASPVGTEMDDFIKTTDPWFRPVNLQFGPDGRLYIADFYNKIIGHYEVPLDHPGRDRESGRIWSVSHVGAKGTKAAVPKPLPKADDLPAWFAELGSADFTRRRLATDFLADNGAEEIVQQARALAHDPAAGPDAFIHAMWILHRLEGLGDKTLNLAVHHATAKVRAHAAGVLSERADWTGPEHAHIMALLADSDPHVVKAAADAAGQHGDLAEFHRLIQARENLTEGDAHSDYAIRRALADLLARGDNLAALRKRSLNESDARAAASVMVGIPQQDAGEFLLDHIQKHKESGDALIDMIRHIARQIPPSRNEELIRFARASFKDNLDLLLDLFRGTLEGAMRRGDDATAVFEWGADLCREVLAELDADASAWTALPIDGLKSERIPWFRQIRKSTDGDDKSVFICSFPPGGERLTGILQSREFKVPEKLTFFLAGHDGFPDQPRKRRNAVRLRNVENGALIAEALAPRHDTAHKIEWDLGKHAAKNARARLEIVDADNGRAYAWIAAGRFDPPVVKLPRINPSKRVERQKLAAGLIKNLKLKKLKPALSAMLSADGVAPEARATAADALVSLEPNARLKALAPLVGAANVPTAIQSRIASALTGKRPRQTLLALAEALTVAPANTQQTLAHALAADRVGSEVLLRLVGQNKVTPRLLLNQRVVDRLLAVDKTYRKRIANLTKGLQPADQRVQQQLAAAIKGFAPGRASMTAGENLFKQNCAACHAVNNQGGKVGPQLDGIGSRGFQRVLEDILDPNRNLDPGFRAENIDLKDDTSLTGLVLREEGELLILADTTGKQHEIRKSDIATRQKSALSLMPANFGDVLKPEQLNHLVGWLMGK